MSDKVYINDFCEDLNYTGVILYIGNVDTAKLRKVLEKTYLNKLYRFDWACEFENPAMKNFIYVENCDLQELCRPVCSYIEDGYDVYVLYEENDGRYYIKRKL